MIWMEEMWMRGPVVGKIGAVFSWIEEVIGDHVLMTL